MTKIFFLETGGGKKMGGFREKAGFSYEKWPLVKGYTDTALHIDLASSGTGCFSVGCVHDYVKERFVGGKGLGLSLLWNRVNLRTKWNDSENPLIIASGPLTGTFYPGAGKSNVVTLSPLTGISIDSNVGGHFGPFLKFAGFDALEIRGKSEEEVVIFIDGIKGIVKILVVSDFLAQRKLSYDIVEFLSLMSADPSEISMVSTGRGAENTLMGCLNFSWYDPFRKEHRLKQAGRGGTGTVFVDKKIKAIAVRCSKDSLGNVGAADPELLETIIRRHGDEIKENDPKQNQMARWGTTHLVEIMNAAGVLPVNNFQFGSHPEAEKIGAEVFGKLFSKGFDGCWKRCAMSCSHCVKDFVLKTGPLKDRKVLVDGPEYETIASLGSNLGIFDPKFILEANYYCDTYGLDTISTGVSIAFAMECFEREIINKRITRGLDLRFGNKEAALDVIHKMANRTGFGEIIGQGVRKMKGIFVTTCNADQRLMEDIGMESKGLEFSMYKTHTSLVQQGGYGFALIGPQHKQNWMIFQDLLGNFPTFEDKAGGLKWFSEWRLWFELVGLCKLPWNDVEPVNNKENPITPVSLFNARAKVPEHVEWYTEFYNVVTGRGKTTKQLLEDSERVINFQRLLALKMGHGTKEDDIIPWRAMGLEGENRAEKIKQYAKLRAAFYKRMGWTKDGIPSFETVKRLGIDTPGVLGLLQDNGIKEKKERFVYV